MNYKFTAVLILISILISILYLLVRHSRETFQLDNAHTETILTFFENLEKKRGVFYIDGNPIKMQQQPQQQPQPQQRPLPAIDQKTVIIPPSNISPNIIRYGDVVKIQHIRSGRHLYSHARNAYRSPKCTHAFGYHEVTCSDGTISDPAGILTHNDNNYWWLIKGGENGAVINYGDRIALYHKATGKYVKLDSRYLSPTTNQTFVGCINDHPTYWIIEDGNGSLKLDSLINLKVVEGSKTYRLHSHSHGNSNYKCNTPGQYASSGQQEVTGFQRDDSNDDWKITEKQSNNGVGAAATAIDQAPPTKTYTYYMYGSGINNTIQHRTAVLAPKSVKVAGIDNNVYIIKDQQYIKMVAIPSGVAKYINTNTSLTNFQNTFSQAIWNGAIIAISGGKHTYKLGTQWEKWTHPTNGDSNIVRYNQNNRVECASYKPGACYWNTHTVDQVNNMDKNTLISNMCGDDQYLPGHWCGMYDQANKKIHIS
jgi:hypothetical protein